MPDFGPLPDDGLDHEYCFRCHAETVTSLDEGSSSVKFHCTTCGALEDRSYYLPASYVRWVAGDGTYWHESAGVFVSRESDGRFLFFQRRFWPRALTIPAGHVELGQTGLAAACRELVEETGLAATQLSPVADIHVVYDPCSAGADSHRWHVFGLRVDDPQLQMSQEGSDVYWLTLQEAAARDLIAPVRTIIEAFGQDLQDRFGS